jgi:hypothetical protein
MYMYNKKKARPGEAEKDKLNRTERMGQAELDRHNGTGQNTTSGSGQGEQDRQSGGQSYIYSVTKSHN